MLFFFSKAISNERSDEGRVEVGWCRRMEERSAPYFSLDARFPNLSFELDVRRLDRPEVIRARACGLLCVSYSSFGDVRGRYFL